MTRKNVLIKNILEFFGVVGVPVVYLTNLYLIAYHNTDEMGLWVMATGLLIALIGIGLWIYSYLSLGNSFGVLPRKQKRVKTGIYKYFNHPMYLGIMMTFVGLSFANGSRLGLRFSLLILMPLLIIRANWEEKELGRYARTTRS
jgi:protein-S-isoprenylcysteine O-methyltransferase Ste14